MVRTFIASVAFAAALHASSLPTPAELSSALASAESAWGVDNLPVELRLEPLGACTINSNKKNFFLSRVNSFQELDNTAITQPLDRVTTFRLDDGTVTLESHEVSYVIRINSSCDWSVLDLNQIMLHELGHAILGPGHSEDRHSIMFYIVDKGQRITPKDRAAARVTLLKAAL